MTMTIVMIATLPASINDSKTVPETDSIFDDGDDEDDKIEMNIFKVPGGIFVGVALTTLVANFEA